MFIANNIFQQLSLGNFISFSSHVIPLDNIPSHHVLGLVLTDCCLSLFQFSVLVCVSTRPLFLIAVKSRACLAVSDCPVLVRNLFLLNILSTHFVLFVVVVVVRV